MVNENIVLYLALRKPQGKENESKFFIVQVMP